MGEAPNLPASVNLARHIAECPTLFPEVNISKFYTAHYSYKHSSRIFLYDFYKAISVIWKYSVVDNLNILHFAPSYTLMQCKPSSHRI